MCIGGVWCADFPKTSNHEERKLLPTCKMQEVHLQNSSQEWRTRVGRNMLTSDHLHRPLTRPLSPQSLQLQSLRSPCLFRGLERHNLTDTEQTMTHTHTEKQKHQDVLGDSSGETCATKAADVCRHLLKLQTLCINKSRKLDSCNLVQRF